MTPEHGVVIRFIGAFVLTFGIMMGFAAIKPKENRYIIYGGALFFVIRILDRLLSADVLQTSFNSTQSQNITHIIFMFLMMLGLIIFAPRKDKN